MNCEAKFFTRENIGMGNVSYESFLKTAEINFQVINLKSGHI